MYQVLWSASFCQLSHLPCIKYFGLPVSVSWVTFHVSSTLVCQFLSAELPLVCQFLSAELSSKYQVLWSASFCQLSYLPCIKYFGLPVPVSCPSLKKRHRRRQSSFGIGLKGMWISSVSLDRLVGLVVKVSASRAEDPGFESRLRWDFFEVESYQ